MTRGNPCTYQILPELNLIDRERSLLLAQVLKWICGVAECALAVGMMVGNSGRRTKEIYMI
ncbi:MAG: hypothetical protein ACBR12_05345 [Microcoleus sp.]|uniref:hypothetical protein n=1 Tax=Microcoleus TaxID=44471 RepID=UPI0030C9C215